MSNTIPQDPIIQWAIIAPGKIAHKFARELKIAHGGQLRAVLSRDIGRARAFATEHGASIAYDDLHALAADSAVDMVYVASPHNAHFDAVKIMLESGKAVLCEKPITINASQAAALIALSQSKRVFLMEAMWTRHLPIYARIHQWIEEGRIGEPRMVSSAFCFQAPRDPSNRLFNPALAGGGLLDLGVYSLAINQLVLGRRPSIINATALMSQSGVDEMLSVSLRYENDAMAQFVCGFNSAFDNALVIGGEKGFIRVPARFIDPQEAILSSDGKIEALHETMRGEGFVYQIEEAMRCFRFGEIESPRMPHADTLATMETMDEIRHQIGLRYPEERQ
ncbi:MAG: Gfo/Idh/MocA family oxidoreductase [Gloeobacteraceae cyanobacterium ES-bin-144]|nr:Gfo/Idh/MocA family oxidoreductase [Verrucomicrobiales bacterium]